MKKIAIGFVIFLFVQCNLFGQAAANFNYDTKTGTLSNKTYNWIDCSAGVSIAIGDDAEASINWPFDFNFYDNNYTTSDALSVASNGFIRLDGIATTEGNAASSFDLISTATNLGQVIAMGVFDGKVGDNSGWIKSLVTGTAPNRVFTIEYNNYEIDYDDDLYADVQVSFYESSNKIVLKLGADNVTQSGADLGIQSGVNDFFNKWQEVESGTNNTWIEYTPPYIEVNATLGTSTAYYSTLRDAFKKINDGTHQENITIKIKHSTTEGNSATLYASGNGSSNYTSVHLYPTETGLSISGNLVNPFIDLRGTENVTIDGRVNATGTTKDLSIINFSSAEGWVSTIRFIHGASNNTVKYCTIKGSGKSWYSSVVFFSSANTESGNSTNTINNNNITNADNANRPVNAILSLGTAGKENIGNIISNNAIYDFMNPAASSHGIHLGSHTTDWIIDGNSFYETTSFVPASTATYRIIRINNTAGNNFTIINNHIGGSEPLCGGTAWTKTSASNNSFEGIVLSVGTTTSSSVQNNTIKNFNWSNSANKNWAGIWPASGNVNIGTIAGNTIGSATGTGSITVTGNTTNQRVRGIYITSSGIVDCQNNTIGSITSNNGSTLASHIYGIYKNSSVGTTTISNNVIGSATTANSINAGSLSTDNNQDVIGIYSSNKGTTVISNNTISNINNSTGNTNTGSRGKINGIKSFNGTATISDNTIYNLSISNANTSSTGSSSVCGMALTGTTGPKTVTGNTIYNLSNSYDSFAGSVSGVYFDGSTSANIFSENFIHSLSVTGANSINAQFFGIRIESGTCTISNNIFVLGGDTPTKIWAIYERGLVNNDHNVYFNTVYISGNLPLGSTNKSYALFSSSSSTNVRDFRNNVLVNARSTDSGVNLHYAAWFNNPSSTDITVDYNNYFVPGTGGAVGYWNGTKITLPIITGEDANSLNIDPGFTNPGGTSTSDYYTSAVLPAVSGTGILTDYQGITRNVPPKMGALESALDYIWQGTTNTDFATPSNWEHGVVPANGADILFAASPADDCYLDQTRTLNDITNTSAKKFVVNGNQLTITGNIIEATANQIDASGASSIVVFEGTAAQSIPAGTFVSNTIDGLTVNNSNGLTQNGDLTIQTVFTLTNGAFTIGANTLTLNGSISTSTGILSSGSASNISIGGTGASTILPGVLLNNLTLNRSNGLSLGGDVNVEGTLILTSGTLMIGANTLTISGNTPTSISGNINTSNTGAGLVFSNSSAIILPSSIFTGNLNNLTINGAGITISEDYTLNGILDLQSANPSATVGSFNTGSFTLTMGGSATIIGIGDVTGIIRRTVFLPDNEYTFGNQFTSITFPDIGTLPTELILKVNIGTLPGWKADGIKRFYDFIQTGGSDTRAFVRFHYLESELNGLPEESLSLFTAVDPYGTPDVLDRGYTELNVIENWITFSNADLAYASSSFGDTEHGIGVSTADIITWDGSESTDWFDKDNWTPVFAPSSDKIVVIPDAATTLYDPLITENTSDTIQKLNIQIGGVLNAGSNSVLTVVGAGGAWNNNGIFNPGTGKVIFNHGIASDIVTIAGSTDFYNVEVGPNTTGQPVAGNIVRIAGTATAYPTSVIDFSSINNTVEWLGTDQTIINPNGIGGNSGYYNLVLSGSGTTTLPNTAVNIAGDFILAGSNTVTAQSALNIGGELKILNGATFATGAFDHTIGGHFDNAGTFNTTPGSTITLNGSSVQNIYGEALINFESLIIDNSIGVDIFTDITVNDALTLTRGNFNVGLSTLAINGGLVKTSGFIDVNPSSSLTFGGTTGLTLPGSLFLATPSINNLTVTRTGGIIASSDLTVNGILNLQSANPSSTVGALETGSYTLTMGDTTTTIGIGEVTGKIKRTTILPNIEYTFGNQFTSVIFPDIGTLPTEITINVNIGTAPGWKPDGIKRILDISQIGGIDTRAVLKAHYLDSELNGLNENDLGYFGYIIPSTTMVDRGLTEINTTDNWITLSNADFGNLSSSFGIIENGFGVSVADVITWDGSESTDWFDQYNWTPAVAPLSTSHVIVPEAATTPNDPLITASASDTILSLDIRTGGILSAGDGSELTVVGSGGAWKNNGIFNPGSGKVIFNHGTASEIVTISGSTDFYNVEVGPNTTGQPAAGNIVRIAGAATAYITSVIDFSNVNNTVEWNGTDQTIINPNGIAGNSGYYNLVLSGSGNKTMPDTPVNIKGDFSTSGTVTTTAAEVLVISGNTVIGSGSTFITGNFNHLLAGDFENNGTFTATSGGVISFNGTTAQTILGTSTTSFDNLTIENELNVSQTSNVNVNNVLLFSDGNLIVGNATLGINGTISNLSGAIEVSDVSNLSFGGTAALIINNNLFRTEPSINDLSINRSGGVTFGNQNMTINGVLDLQAGTLTLAANSLTIDGNTLTQTTGNIDASNTSATLAFTNSAVITLPASVFSGNINNLTINGAGVNAGGDISIDGVLSLSSVNQSATVGSLYMSTYTLNMGASATTTGIGDVTGIVKREHTFLDGVEYSFGNQYTNLNFLNVPGSTKPDWVSCKIEIGTAPTWRSEAINRFYSFAQSGGNDRMIVKLHYLDSELHGAETDESQLVFWDAYDPALGVNNFVNYFPRSKNGNNATNNWVQLTGPAINYIATSDNLDVKQWGLSYSDVTVHTWIGLGSVSYPGDWSLPGHWDGGVPQEGDVVLIPTTLPIGNSGYPYRNLLSSIAPSVVKSVEIETGATLGVSDYDITVYGDGDAWINNGSFTPGTGNVIFANADLNNTVTVSGTTNFNNLTITDKTHLHLGINSITRVAGILNAGISSVLDFNANANLVEYNGDGNQAVINPSGAANPGYNDLILSGSGTKTFSGTTIATGGITVSESITIDGDGASTTFVQAAASEGIASNGVFTVESGKTVTISDMTIRYGNTTISGGGINNSGTLTITNSAVSDNVASLNGGGIYNDGGTLTVINSTISNNTATNGGGIYNVQSITDPALVITNSTISDNLATLNGGGTSLEGGGRTTITNSTIANNHSDNGNSGSGRGGGVYYSSDSLTVINSIIANNYQGSTTGTGDDYYYSAGGLTDGGYNVVEYANVAANATGGFNSATSVLYNTRNVEAGTNFSSWTQAGSILTNQILGLSSTLALNDATNETYTLALASNSFALARECSGIPLSSNWNNSPEINGAYTDQRGVVRTADQSTSIGAYSENYLARINPTTGGTIGDAQTICPGSVPVALTSLSLPAGHTGTLEYKWQSSTIDATSGFVDIALSNSAIYSPGPLAETTWFISLARVYCESDWSGAASSNVIEITADDAINPTISCVGNQTVDSDLDETFYTVSGTEFDPIATDDNCGIQSVINGFNSLASLAGAQLPVGTNTIVWTISDNSGNQEICTFDVIVNSTIGINSGVHSDISIYPNPTTGIIKLSTGDINVQKISVADIAGRTIIEKKNLNHIDEIDLSGYESGVFIISIQTDKNILTKKVIKN